MKYLIVALLLFFSLPVSANENVQFSQEMQDGQDGIALLGPAMGMLQIPMQMLGGNSTEAQAALNANLTQVKSFLEKHPDSPLGLYLKASLMELAKTGSGQADYKRLVMVTTNRMKEEPNYAGNYEMRAKGFEALGHIDPARADLTQAIKLTTDPKKKEKLTKELAELGR